MQKILRIVVSIGVASLLVAGCAPGTDEEPAGSRSQPLSCAGAIDCGNFNCAGAVACTNLEKVPASLDWLIDESSKVAKILGNVNTGISAARTVLELLNVIDSAGEQQAAQFAELKAQLTQIGVTLSTQALITARENRLSSMRGYINTVTRFAQRTGTGLVDESVLSPSEIVELGVAKSNSQMVAQNAGDSSSFKRLYSESVTDGTWKSYISARPNHDDGLAFDWRLGVAEYLQLVNSRLAIIAATQPNFRLDGEFVTELGQYRTTIQGLINQMTNDGIRCNSNRDNPLTVVCADIFSGLSATERVSEPRCRENYVASTCDARISAEKLRMTRALKMQMPLFQLRAMADALSSIVTGGPDLTATTGGGNGYSGIHLRGSGQQSCLGQYLGYWVENPDDPFNPIQLQDKWTTSVDACTGSADQLWSYDRPSGNIRNTSGACLTPAEVEAGGSLAVQTCTGSVGEKWTYDPVSGTLLNGFHTLLSGPVGPPPPWTPPAPRTTIADNGSNEHWDDTRETYNLAWYWWGTAYVSSDPYGRGGDVAIDGNTDGNWSNGSVTHTDSGWNQWGGGQYWFVDLHSEYWVHQLNIYNRTDCCWDRLSHFQVLGWNSSIGNWEVIASRANLSVTSSAPISVLVNAHTQYVMVQKTDAGILSLAEVEVIGY